MSSGHPERETSNQFCYNKHPEDIRGSSPPKRIGGDIRELFLYGHPGWPQEGSLGSATMVTKCFLTPAQNQPLTLVLLPPTVSTFCSPFPPLLSPGRRSVLLTHCLAEWTHWPWSLLLRLLGAPPFLQSRPLPGSLADELFMAAQAFLFLQARATNSSGQG